MWGLGLGATVVVYVLLELLLLSAFLCPACQESATRLSLWGLGFTDSANRGSESYGLLGPIG